MWALNRAKDNVSRWYRVVGILDNIPETLEVLEREFPYFFNGAGRIYDKIRKLLSRRRLLLKKYRMKILQGFMYVFSVLRCDRSEKKIRRS